MPGTTRSGERPRRGTGTGVFGRKQGVSTRRIRVGSISAGDGLMALGRFCSVAVLALCWLGASVSTGFAAKDNATTSSGLPVPRYVSLKSDHVNVRAGPTKDNDVA